ncbi:HAD-IIA family hydrolase [Rhodococcus rhodnii]|uniref:Hydrolase n=2 Tax=Rhodococcus rhodnii TaxID=38312 RepID=R7WRL8_9NOCA|nr:HAD-IIA family hydrolase [Rhodococcus rhodnii]EOM77951.1 hydrolase [Rhodococcus rhodnii LMG 5362]TXG92030.1 HAD-IIA family hydrolase [Rhodococcus rhodnii]
MTGLLDGTARGVLFDIDGVLVTSWNPIGGAAEAVEDVRARGLARAFLTNTTSKSTEQIVELLAGAGIDVEVREIVTAARLTAEYLRTTYPGRRVWMLNHGDIAEDFADIEFDEADPEVVVLGGAGSEYTHEALSRAVDLVLGGVPAVAMHRGQVWAAADGLRVDVGTYLPGIEEVTGTRIVSVGKPGVSAFLAATELMGTMPEQTIMVGDDLTSDVLRAQQVGLTGVLVKTGKFRDSVLSLSPERPDHVLESVADLPTLLDRLA